MLTRDLPLDLNALREKDRRDRSKLKAMIELCYDDQDCRQEQILALLRRDREHALRHL
jgi:ATP-dependent DNA helicase RecQ